MRKIKPTIDELIYNPSLTSFSGNSLKGTKVLLFCNQDASAEWVNIAKQYLSKESGHVDVSYYQDDTHNMITEMLSISPIHIINYFALSRLSVLQIYQSLQCEVEALIKNDTVTTICSIFVHKEQVDYDDYVKKGVVTDMTNGLASLLGNHNMICSGITTEGSVPLDTVAQAAIFLSSKYGYLFSGKVIQLNGHCAIK